MRYGKTLRFKLLFGFLMMMLPLIAFLIYNNFYAIQVVRNQVAQSNKNLVSLYMGQIDRNLEEADMYLYNMAVRETDLLILDHPIEQNSQEYYRAKIRLFNKISNDISAFKMIDKFFIYSSMNDDLVATQGLFNESYQDWEISRNEIVGIFHDDQSREPGRFDQWFTVHDGANYFLCRVVKAGDVYVGAWVKAQRLTVPMHLIDIGDKGKALLATGDYEPMDEKGFIQENHIDLRYDRNDDNLTGSPEKFLAVGEKSKEGNFSLIVLIPDEKILEKLPYLRQIVTLISIGSIVILPIVFLFFRKAIFLPIRQLVMAMRKIKDGHLEVRIAQTPVPAEFELMNDTFNRMVEQIQELKINVYEEQLYSQKAELQHLQLQINPHFFLNSLNIIHNLAQVKDYGLIQEMSICLVRYFRFMFRSNLNFVSLTDEVENTRNYLQIQELRFPGNLTYEIHVSEELSNAFVPPLVIQTFVENAIKHAVTMDDPVHIQVSVVPDETDPKGQMKLMIQDSGKGFPQDVLAQLQSETETTGNQGERIGIWNVKRRLRLLYKDQARIRLSNRLDGGAIIEIGLPVVQEG
jgi:two-component system, sensor histidine kinase YesM